MLESDSEMLITMMGAFAQAESESISQNVRWGKRQAMREGKAVIQYKHLYAYERGEDGKPKIIPEQAEVVKRIFESCLAGHSMRMIKDELERDGILTVKGGTEWSIASITNILRNEKYCGDALQQKTFISDCISGKVIRNTGQLPMYLVQDHHEGIISRDTYNAVQAELARRNAAKAPSRKSAPTGRSCYTSKYALSDRLICGDCGTLYRRCVWTHHGKARRYQLDRQGASYRVNHRSWWKEELPSDEEYAKALETLERAGWKVDYVITHCPPSGIVDIIAKGAYEHDELTDFFDMVSKRLEFHYWLFGHHHDNRAIGQNYILLYEQIVQVV